MGITRILVPVDFSNCSMAALESAAELAERFGASIDVLHVWEPLRAAALESVTWRGDRALVEFAHTNAGTQMRDFLSLLEERELPSVRGRLDVGVPWSAIVRVAYDDDYDLIVMGTHGRTGLAHLFMGSITEKVMRQAPCPVLTISTTARRQAPAVPIRDEHDLEVDVQS